MGRARPKFPVRGRYPPSRASEAAAKMKRCGNSEEVDSSQRALAARAPKAQEGRSCAQRCVRPSLLIRLRELAHLLVRIRLCELAYLFVRRFRKGLIDQNVYLHDARSALPPIDQSPFTCIIGEALTLLLLSSVGGFFPKREPKRPEK